MYVFFFIYTLNIQSIIIIIILIIVSIIDAIQYAALQTLLYSAPKAEIPLWELKDNH